MKQHFRVTLEAIDSRSGRPTGRSVRADITNHDDLFETIGKISARGVVPENEAVEFAIGLKLFTEVMLRHRKHEPFGSLQRHIGVFMKHLKSAEPRTQSLA